MGLIDFILNLAGLLLWLNWRAAKADPLGKPTPATLIGTLRRAEPANARRWHLPAALGGLLLLRALFYWQIGSALKPVWAGTLDLGIIVPSFVSSSFWRILLFSIFSLARLFGIVYLWLLLLSILGGPMPTHRLVRMQLGTIDGWPRWIKFLLPLAVIGLLWWLASWLLAWLGIIPKPLSAMHRIEESLVIALGSYLIWKFLIATLLMLHLLNSYIYFGRHPFWNYINATANQLLRPLQKIPLRAGRADFAPVAGIALVFLLAGLAGRALISLYGRLPL